MDAKKICIGCAMIFLISRVTVFNCFFASAIAISVVLLSADRVYVYILPVVFLAVGTHYGTLLTNWGDILALIACDLIILFFYKHVFLTNELVLMTMLVTCITKISYYYMANLYYLIDWIEIFREILILGILVYIYRIGTMVFLREGFLKRHDNICSSDKNLKEVDKGYSLENIGISAIIICSIAVLGIGKPNLALGIITVMALILSKETKFLNGLLAVCTFAVVTVLSPNWPNITQTMLIMIMSTFASNFAAQNVSPKYRKAVMSLFFIMPFATVEEEYIVSLTIGAIVFILGSDDFYRRVVLTAHNYAVGTAKNEMDIRLDNVRSEIKYQRNLFRQLSELYMISQDSRQIISHQFRGMERVVEKIMAILDKNFQKTNGQEEKNFKIETAIGSYAKEGVSGDSSIALDLSDGMTVLLLSDGMGQGERAATESRLLVSTLAKLLDAGFEVELAMKTINGIMLRRSPEEIFATLDMAYINQKTGRTKLFKMGAATSFVKRGEKVVMVKSHSLPIGIVDSLKLEYVDLKLKKGDVLIMVSDGIMDCDRCDMDGKWLRQRIKEINTKNPETLADLIINKSIEKYQERERDDLSVLVAKMN